MPVRLTQNVSICPEKEYKGGFKEVQSRKKSRLSVYLNTARASDSSEKELSIFNETRVQNVLQEQQERKKNLKTREKLKLVWKAKYNLAKSPQEALTELLAQRTAPRRLRFTTANKGKVGHSIIHGRDSANKPELGKRKASLATSGGNSSNLFYLNESSDPKSVQRITQKNAFSTSSTIVAADEKLSSDDMTPVYDASTVITAMNDRRQSRSIFTTKKATGHQEHNLFCYRGEKKRPIPPTANIKKKVSVKRKSSLFDALMAMQLEKERLVPEIQSKIDVDTILRAYLSEQVLDLELRGPEADAIRHMYTATILHQPVINNFIMKHPNMLPPRIFKDLVTYKKGFEAKPIYLPTVVKSNEGPWRETCFKYLSSPTGNVLIELENDVPQYSNFYKILLEERFQAVEAKEPWLSERNNRAIRENLLHTSVSLRIGRQNPGSTVRLEILRIFIAAARNKRLLRQLSLSIEGWLDQLVKGLYSPFKSVREETCQVLCLMTTSYPVMRELYLSKYFDVIQDLSLAIFRAIDQYEDTFPEYYILLAHIIHYSPSRSIIECILDRWTNFRCVGLILQWPRLLYYALRYWPDDELCLGNRLFCIRITKALEAGLQRPLSTKACRSALYYLQMRFRNVSHLFTIYHNKESAQSSFMTARAQLCV